MHRALLPVLLVVAFIAFVLPVAVSASPSASPSPGFTQVGEASWYGGDFHGRRTASGERFDKHGFSAAHRTLPMGTLVRVENLANGYSVEVRINDRGPFVSDRIIDLSKGAAVQLDMHHAGKARVRITVLDRTARDGEPPTIRFM